MQNIAIRLLAVLCHPLLWLAWLGSASPVKALVQRHAQASRETPRRIRLSRPVTVVGVEGLVQRAPGLLRVLSESGTQAISLGDIPRPWDILQLVRIATRFYTVIARLDQALSLTSRECTNRSSLDLAADRCMRNREAPADR